MAKCNSKFQAINSMLSATPKKTIFTKCSPLVLFSTQCIANTDFHKKEPHTFQVSMEIHRNQPLPSIANGQKQDGSYSTNPQ